jgi:hypothetical protein
MVENGGGGAFGVGGTSVMPGRRCRGALGEGGVRSHNSYLLTSRPGLARAGSNTSAAFFGLLARFASRSVNGNRSSPESFNRLMCYGHLDVSVVSHVRIELDRGAVGVGAVTPESVLQRREQRSLRALMKVLAAHD